MLLSMSPVPTRRGRSPHLPARPPKASQVHSCSPAGVGGPSSAAYHPSSLICYFSLNTPTPITPVILGSDGPAPPNATRFVGRLCPDPVESGWVPRYCYIRNCIIDFKFYFCVRTS